MKKIQLINNLIALVDSEVYDKVKDYRWRYNIQTGAAMTNFKQENGKWTTKTLHRMIYGNKNVIPKNGNWLDMRKSNILFKTEFCAIKDQQRKQYEMKPQSSRYLGVYRPTNGTSKKWRAAIGHNGKHIILGYFNEEIEAAKAYDKKAIELKGKDTILNFPKNKRRKNKC